MRASMTKAKQPPRRSSVASAPAAQEIQRLLEAGQFRSAVLKAAKMQDLGPQRDRILSAREAYQRPDFQAQIGRDPLALINEGIAALRERFCHGA